MEEVERYRGHRGLRATLLLIMVWLGIALALYQTMDIPLTFRGLPWFDMQQFGPVTLGALAAGLFIYSPLSKRASKQHVPWYDFALAILVVAAFLYLAFQYERRLRESWVIRPPQEVVALSVIIILITMEGIRRSVGYLFFGVVGLFMIYPLLAPNLPGILQAPGFDWQRLAAYFSLSEDGMLGTPVSVLISVLLPFFLFIAVLYATGGSDFIINMALATAGRFRGGPAKVAIVASSMFGSMSGSAIANVASTGSVTIPLMKRTGFKPEYAGAVEAMASTGGQLMPPVMGITAFVMADFLGVSYSRVVLAAIIPSILYYLCAFIQVHYRAVKEGMVGLPAKELPPLGATLRSGWFVLASMVVLMWLMLFMRYAPGKSAIYAAIVVILGSLFSKETRPDQRKIMEFFTRSVKSLGEVAPLLMASGIIIASATVTGLGGRFSGLLVGADTGLVTVIIAAALASFILGMGMPIIGVYIITAIFIAPAIIKLGLPALPVHLSLLYWAMLSFLTPPVCLAVYVACGIANSNVWKTGFHAVRLGIVAYAVPFLMFLQPALVFEGTADAIVKSLVFAVAMSVFVGQAVEGWAFRRMEVLERLCHTLAGVLLAVGVVGDWWIGASGLALGIAVLAWNRASAKRIAPTPSVAG